MSHHRYSVFGFYWVMQCLYLRSYQCLHLNAVRAFNLANVLLHLQFTKHIIVRQYILYKYLCAYDKIICS
jgi:hypothetical protein